MAEDQNVAELTARVVSAYLSANTVSPDEAIDFMSRVYRGFGDLIEGKTEAPAPVGEAKPEPAFNPKRSVKPDGIVSLIDGKKYKALKRHLGSHGLTPQQYRERYDLPADYPMVSANYSTARSEMAKKFGLGRKPGQKRGRKPGAKAGSK